MTKHETVQKINGNHPGNALLDEVTIGNKYEQHRSEFLKILE